MTSRCFNFRFAYPLPLLPHLHTARMASGHPTDKFSFMYQPDTHKRYGARMHTHLHARTHTRNFVGLYSQWAGKWKWRACTWSLLRCGEGCLMGHYLAPSARPFSPIWIDYWPRVWKTQKVAPCWCSGGKIRQVAALNQSVLFQLIQAFLCLWVRTCAFFF